MRIRFSLCVLLALSTGCGIKYFRDPYSETPLTGRDDLIRDTENLISLVLVSPGSAKFSDEVVTENPAKHQVIVTGNVDSQNSFGGLMRSKFENVYVTDSDGHTTHRGVLSQRDQEYPSYF